MHKGKRISMLQHTHTQNMKIAVANQKTGKSTSCVHNNFSLAHLLPSPTSSILYLQMHIMLLLGESESELFVSEVEHSVVFSHKHISHDPQRS